MSSTCARWTFDWDRPGYNCRVIGLGILVAIALLGFIFSRPRSPAWWLFLAVLLMGAGLFAYVVILAIRLG